MGDSILFGWKATYKLAGAPDFLLEGKSTARIRDGLIVELTDGISGAQCIAANDYLIRYASSLKSVP